MKKLFINTIILFLSGIHVSGQLTLQSTVNGSSTDTILAGSPVYIHVQVYNPFDEFAIIHNDEVERNRFILKENFKQNLIDEEEYTHQDNRLTQSKKELKPQQVNPMELYDQIQVSLNERILPREDLASCFQNNSSTGIITLEGSNRIRWFFAIFPEITKQWKPGDHLLQVNTDTLVSKPMLITIRPDSVPDQEELELLLEVAYFHVDCGDASKAGTIVKNLLDEFPQSLEAHVLMADVMLVQENFTSALKYFTEALRLFNLHNPDSSEIPEYILEQIKYLNSRQ